MQVSKHYLILVLLVPAGAAYALAGGAATVAIGDLAFSPGAITAHVGDTVEWVNSDYVDHTATSNSGEFDIAIPAGQKAEMKLTRAGEFGYICRYHPNMTGVIRVLND